MLDSAGNQKCVLCKVFKVEAEPICFHYSLRLWGCECEHEEGYDYDLYGGEHEREYDFKRMRK